jgi:hypothetical protein
MSESAQALAEQFEEFMFNNHEIDPYTGQDGPGLQQSEAFPCYESHHRVPFDPEHNELHKNEMLLVRARMSTLFGEIQQKLAGRRSMDLPGEEDNYLHCSDERLMGLGEKLEMSIRSQHFLDTAAKSHFSSWITSTADPNLGPNAFELQLPIITDDHWIKIAEEWKMSHGGRLPHVQMRFQVYKDFPLIVKRIGGIHIGNDERIPMYRDDIEYLGAGIEEMLKRLNQAQQATEDAPPTERRGILGRLTCYIAQEEREARVLAQRTTPRRNTAPLLKPAP